MCIRDRIDFTARLFGLSGKEAALKLAEDFSVRYDAKGHDPPRRRQMCIRDSLWADQGKGWKLFCEFPAVRKGCAILVREEFSCLEFIMNRDCLLYTSRCV